MLRYKMTDHRLSRVAKVDPDELPLEPTSRHGVRHAVTCLVPAIQLLVGEATWRLRP